MAKQNFPVYSFNKGEISRHALGRLDAESLQLAAETQVNWMPMTLGPMTMRPGLEYIGATRDNLPCVIRPFIFATDDTAILEYTDQTLRIWVDDELVTGESVATTVTNGDFSDSTGWTLTTTSGAEATISGGKLTLNALALGSSASCEREVTIALADRETVHRLRIVVERGPVGFQVGTSSGNFNLFDKTELGPGDHSIAFDPAGASSFFVRFYALDRADEVVDSIEIETGTVELPTPWRDGDLSLLRWDQSGDIVFVAQEAAVPRKIERRDNNSWSVVKFQQFGGPYVARPAWTNSVRMDPGAGTGGTNAVTAFADFFESSKHVDRLFAAISEGHNRGVDISAVGKYLDPLYVSGVTQADRQFKYYIRGTWVGTISLQRSTVGPDGGFVEVATQTGNIEDEEFTDHATHENVDCWYRLGFSEYTSGYATVLFTYSGGRRGRGEARIFNVASPTHADYDIIHPFQSGELAHDWELGEWSHELGWPAAVAFHDGRLFFAARDKIWGSVSDDFENFDVTFEGEAGPINRSFGYGPFANVNWLSSLNRLVVGRDSSVVSIRSSNFDEPLTPTDFTMRDSATVGTFELQPAKVDKSAIFVDGSGRRVYELRYKSDAQDYGAIDLTALNPDIGLEGFVDLSAQRELDTRIHLVRGNGEVAVLSHEADQVEAWWRIETDGDVESVCVLPGSLEDQVYYVVKRTIYSLIEGELQPVTRRYLEKFARQDECLGAAMNKLADSFITYTGPAISTITGLSHLEGKEVVIWGNGKDLGTATVSGGQVTTSEPVQTAVVGLGYEARFKSTKLGIGATQGSALTQKKKIETIGLLLADTHNQGIEYGQSFERMDPLPLVVEGVETPTDTIWTEFDNPMVPLPGVWQTDARLCLRATAPRPATVLAAVIGVSTHDKP